MRFTHFSCCLLLLLAACAKSTPEVREAPNGIGLATELLEPGAEPREQLRYARGAGLSEDLVIEFGLATLFESADATATVEQPVLALGLNGKTENCGEDGACNYTFKFSVVGVKMPEGSTEDEAAQIAAAVAPLAKVSGAFKIDNRGITERADLIVPPGVSPRLLTLLGNIRTSLITLPLPEEAVGVGARWKVQRVHAVGPIQTTQTVTYNLLERQARVLRLGVTFQQSAAPQDVALSVDTNLKVETYEVSGTSSMVMSLDGITPLSESHATSELRAIVTEGQQTEALRAAGVLDVVVAPVASNAPTAN